MREIKFRIPMFTDKGTFTEFQYLKLGDDIEGTLCGHNGEPQQYTGLKDKNSKEIYEGDIVKWKNLNTLDKEIRITPVYLHSIGDGKNHIIEAYYPFCNTVSGSYKENNREVVECYITPPDDCEIIGNIYENPKLLTTQPQE